MAARRVELDGLETASFDLVTAQGTQRVRLPVPGLYNVYNALAASSVAIALGAGLPGIASALGGFRAAFGRFERVVAGDRRAIVLLIKNPAGANEAVRTLVEGGVPPTLVVALNDAIADGRDVSWIWDVDFEPLLQEARRVVVSGQRAAELALRFTYAGLDATDLEIVPELARALDRGLELAGSGGEVAVLPTYTAMLRLQAILRERGLTRPYWERGEAS
jgi:UDP-N-acetylmuramyl tripeptide synthase